MKNKKIKILPSKNWQKEELYSNMKNKKSPTIVKTTAKDRNLLRVLDHFNVWEVSELLKILKEYAIFKQYIMPSFGISDNIELEKENPDEW
jgi:hypothetical protein